VREVIRWCGRRRPQYAFLVAIDVEFHEDPARVLDEAGDFLGSEPVLHNVIHSLLHTRVASVQPGRYWVARDGGEVVGVVFQSPLDFAAGVTQMGPEVIAAVVAAIADGCVVLPGVLGEAATAARFAGQWTERCKCAAFPVHGQRIYEISEVRQRPTVAGRARVATATDRPLLLDWMRGFNADTGTPDSAVSLVDQRLPAGQFWLWEDGEPAAVAAHTDALAGVARVQAVYTPPEKRSRGYAGALVADLSDRMLHSGHRCILYADLSNPTSNSVYRRIGYRAAAEVLRYRFG
jgi:uncharacterized protein